MYYSDPVYLMPEIIPSGWEKEDLSFLSNSRWGHGLQTTQPAFFRDMKTVQKLPVPEESRPLWYRDPPGPFYATLYRDELEAYLKERQNFFSGKECSLGDCFLHILIDEVLNEVFSKDSQVNRNILMKIWQYCLDHFQGRQRSRWNTIFLEAMQDYALLHPAAVFDIPDSLLEEPGFQRRNSHMRNYLDILLESHSKVSPFTLSLGECLAISGSSITRRNAYEQLKKDLQRMTPRAVSFMDAWYQSHTGKPLLANAATAGSNELFYDRYFSNEDPKYYGKIHVRKLPKYEPWPYRKWLDAGELSDMLSDLLSAVYSQCAAANGISSPPGRPRRIEKVLQLELRRFVREEYAREKNQVELSGGAVLDKTVLEQLRKDSDHVRASLQVQEARRQISLSEFEDWMHTLSPRMQQTLKELYAGSGSRRDLDALNASFFRAFSENLIRNGHLDPDWALFSDSVESLQLPQQDQTAEKQGLASFLDGLDEAHRNFFLAVLRQDAAGMEQAAADAFSMPDLMADEINEEALSVLSGIVLEEENGVFRVAEDFAPEASALASL